MLFAEKYGLSDFIIERLVARLMAMDPTLERAFPLSSLGQAPFSPSVSSQNQPLGSSSMSLSPRSINGTEAIAVDAAAMLVAPARACAVKQLHSMVSFVGCLEKPHTHIHTLTYKHVFYCVVCVCVLVHATVQLT
jgi:hypothetical protein